MTIPAITGATMAIQSHADEEPSEMKAKVVIPLHPLGSR
jgi:hypothetical protein